MEKYHYKHNPQNPQQLVKTTKKLWRKIAINKNYQFFGKFSYDVLTSFNLIIEVVKTVVSD